MLNIELFFLGIIQERDKEDVFTFVSVDCDLYALTKAGLEFFFPRLSKGGMIICHDFLSEYGTELQRL